MSDPISDVPLTTLKQPPPISASGDQPNEPGPSFRSQRDTDYSFKPSPTERTDTLQSGDAQRRHGYPRIAHRIGHDPNFAIYRRFASLNARSLLYLQAEIICLEHELNDLEQLNNDDKNLHYSVSDLRNARPGSNGWRLWKKVGELREKLDQYNRLLLEQKRLHDLPSPSVTNVIDVYNFVHNAQAEDLDPEDPVTHGRWLQFPENTVWEYDYDHRGKEKIVQEDLVSLSSAFTARDPFTNFVADRCVTYFHKIYRIFHPPDDQEGAYEYSDTIINRIINATTLVVASLMPTSSIIALYYITSPLFRLIFILVFSAIFTTSLSIFTSATRIEIFAASVALASVQAVFVGTNFGN